MKRMRIFTAPMLAGATGYVLKDVPRDELILAIRTVASGQRYMSRTAGAKLAGQSGLLK
jgi:DNA-binding NarL/FixJ family response regulator